MEPFVILALLLIGVFVYTFYVDNKTLRIILRVCSLIGLAASIHNINGDLPKLSFKKLAFRPMSLFRNKKKKPAATPDAVDLTAFTTKYD